MKYIPLVIVGIVLAGLVFFRVLHYIGNKENPEEEDTFKKSKWKLRLGEKKDPAE